MDALDLFFKKFSYKFPKGYPDINNEQDVLLLESILENLNINVKLNELKKPFEFLSPLAQKVGQQLMDAFNVPKDNIRSSTKNRIVLLLDIPRPQVFQTLEDLGFKKNIMIPGSSAGGYITPEGIEIIHKSKSLTAMGGAGVENENIFVDTINNYIDQSDSEITIEIKSTNGKKLTFNNVSKANHVGKEGESKGWKGDAQIVSGGNTIAISIKKDGPFRWESAMTRFEDFVKTFLTKAYDGEISNLELNPDPENPKVLQMWNPSNDKPYGRIFVTDVPGLTDEQTLKSIAFGKDNAIIIQKTFTENDFKFNENTNILNITVSNIIESLDDFEEEDLPILEFERNASKATKLEGPFGRGIILRISPKGRALNASSKANNLILSYNDVMS
jgi:hypothetical protein